MRQPTIRYRVEFRDKEGELQVDYTWAASGKQALNQIRHKWFPGQSFESLKMEGVSFTAQDKPPRVLSSRATRWKSLHNVEDFIREEMVPNPGERVYRSSDLQGELFPATEVSAKVADPSLG